MAFKRPGSKSASKSGGKFVYRKPSAEDMRARQNQRWSNRETVIRENAKIFVPDKEHIIRFLPPTWPEEEGRTHHFGYDVFLHYGVGVDGGTFLCPKQMKGEECPICDLAEEAMSNGDEELAAAAKVKKRVAYYIIDRDHESEGPKVWLGPVSFDKEVTGQAVDKRTGEVLALDSPYMDEETQPPGYDVELSIQGKRPNIKYVHSIARSASPLSDDEDAAEEWLEHISETPLPDLLVWHDSAYLEKAVAGGVKTSFDDGKGKKEDEDDEKQPKPKGRFAKRKDAYDEEEVEKGLRKAEGVGSRKPLGKKKVEEDAEEEYGTKKTLRKRKPALPSYEEVLEMEEESLVDLGEKHGVDFDEMPEELEGEDIAKWLAEQLGLEAPEEEEEEQQEEEKETPKSRLAKLRKNLSSKK